jgi:hypothetical protein
MQLGVRKQATIQAIEEWTNSARGRKKSDDIATESAREVAWV